MRFFRRRLRLAVKGPGSGLAIFHWRPGEDPKLERWIPESPPPSWRLIRRTDSACEGVIEIPFLHIDVRTPYGESAAGEQVEQAVREALGSKADSHSLRGWHVAHLEDTNLGSNHRIFATLEKGTGESGSAWDQAIPLEIAMQALGDWVARRTGRSLFQLVTARAEWIYSLLYRNAQPYHILRVPGNPPDFALKRLAEHRAVLQQDGGEPLLFLDAPDPLRSRCGALGIEPEGIPLGAEFSSASGPNPWHFALALAATREEADIHNRAPSSQRARNSEIRLWDRMAVFSAAAAVLGGAVLLAETARFAATGSALAVVKIEADRYAGKIAAMNHLRSERAALLDSLSTLRPLWNRPVPMDRLLREIAEAIPPNGGVEGVLLRKGEGGRRELTFRAWVEDWNQIRPLQERLRRSPFFSGVDLSDQRKETEHRRVAFQAACILAGPP